MGKYIFGIMRGNKQQFFIAPSANKAKKIRSKYIPQKDIIISPIININNTDHQSLPIIFKKIIKGDYECHEQ